MIGEGTKIDNLVQIAHNCEIGRHCVMAAFTGISGSVTVGDYVMMGGRVGIADNVTIGVGRHAGCRQRRAGQRSGQHEMGRLSGRSPRASGSRVLRRCGGSRAAAERSGKATAGGADE